MRTRVILGRLGVPGALRICRRPWCGPAPRAEGSVRPPARPSPRRAGGGQNLNIKCVDIAHICSQCASSTLFSPSCSRRAAGVLLAYRNGMITYFARREKEVRRQKQERKTETKTKTSRLVKWSSANARGHFSHSQSDLSVENGLFRFNEKPKSGFLTQSKNSLFD